MSLIQEALKRQQEEYENSGAPGDSENKASAVSPKEKVQPSSKSAAETKPAKHSTAKIWTVIFGIVLLIIAAIGAAFYLVNLFMSRLATEATVETKADIVVAESDESVLIDVRPEPVSLAANALPENEQPPPPPVEDVIAPETPFQPADDDTGAPGEEPEPAVEQPRITTPEDVVVPKWPRLRLTAVFVGLGEGESSAIINGKMVSEGSRIDEVMLKDVRHDGVLLELGAETRFLRMGTSL